MNGQLFSARAASKRYELGETEVVALAGVDLDIAAGEFVTIAGPSGSGKSTLLHLLGALDAPDEGSVAIEGRDLATISERPAAVLSGREREVLEGIARGVTQREIAESLGVSIKTVETYRARIADKLGLLTRAELVDYALRSGLLRKG